MILAGSAASAGVDEAAGRPASAVAAELGAGVGSYRPYGLARLSIDHQFFRRLDLALALRLSVGQQLVLVGPSARIAVILHLSPEVDLHLGGDLGYAAMRVVLPLASPWIHQAVFSSVAELRITLPVKDLELRASPMVVTAFWNRVWGFSFEPSVGVAYGF